MVQFKILTGSRAGTVHDALQFPFVIGRSPAAGLSVPEPGVWDQHLKITHEADDNFHVQLLPGAIATVNGQTFNQVPLKNGDTLELGSLKLQFWLSETKQHDLGLREQLTWAALAALMLLQGFLMYRLTQ